MNARWLKLVPSSLRLQIKKRANLHSVLANASWLITEKMIRMLVGVIVGTWVARYLGPTQFGELAYALALTAFFQAFATLGLDGVVVRDISREPQRANEILGTTLWLRIACGLLAWIVAIGCILIFRPGDTRALILVALISSGIVFQAADTIDLWFQSQSQSRRTVVVKLIALTISASIKIILIQVDAPLIAFAAAQVLELIIGAIALSMSYRWFRSSGSWAGTISVAKILLYESWPLLLSGLSVMIYMRINQIMLRQIAGEQELGLFAAILPFIEAWNFLPVTICISFAPLIARKKIENEAQYIWALQRLFSVLFWLALLIAILMACFSSWIVDLLLGPRFAGSGTILAIGIFTLVPVFMGVAQGLWIINERKPMIFLYNTMVGAIFSVVLNLMLIPKWGANGAAIASVASYFLSAIFANLLFTPIFFLMQIRAIFFQYVK
ncbi:MAG: flippase [Burkholderiales bacterium]